MQNLTFIDSNGQELARPGSMPGALGIMLTAGGDGADESRGTVLLLLNAGREPVVFKLPDPDPGYTWEGLIDTSRATGISDFRFTSGQVLAARETALSQGSRDSPFGARGGVGGSEYAGQEAPGDIIVFDLEPRSVVVFRLKSFDKK
jgi:hypothetical protein